ncbi:MAG TPA: hypothetical protein VF251_03100 [Pyrinomonadaceae bacterium]
MNTRVNLPTAKLLALLTVLLLFRGVALSQERVAKQARPLAPTYKFEFEDLLTTAKTSNGDFGRQEMKNFGAGWSGDAQLFWRLGPCGTAGGGASPYTYTGGPFTPGPHLSVEFNVPVAGVYEIVLHYTAGPDFGRFDWSFSPSAPNPGEDAYAPTVRRKTTTLGEMQLTTGSKKFNIWVQGRRLDSKGCSIGLDRLDLMKIDTKLKLGTTKQVQKP